MKHVFIKRVIIAYFFLLPALSYSQNESSNWYFGINAGVTFNSGSPVALTNGALSTHEGVATISDHFGTLLFYTDGIRVYNSLHAIMANGNGLNGDPSSTQSAIIVKKPLSPNLYYVFTMDAIGGSLGFRYSVVDMLLNGGLGDVTQKNILVYASTRERLTSIKHSNGTDFWILMNSFNTDRIHAYLLDSTGLDSVAVISNVGPIHNGSSSNSRGYMKASRQNDRLAIATWDRNEFVLLNFDNSTGIADSASRMNIGGSATAVQRTYGVEFSPDGTKLYGTTLQAQHQVIQFDLSSGNDSIIFNTRDTLGFSLTASGCGGFYYGALQLGPDGKIYGVAACDSFLNVINFPDLEGPACGYVAHGVSLAGNDCDLGLPNFISDYILPINTNENFKQNIDFVLYPNPASDQIVVSLKSINGTKNPSYSICDILGNVIMQSNLTGSFSNIKLSNLSNGIYILRVNDEKSFSAKKFVVSQ